MSGSVRLSQLPAVASVQTTDEFEVSQGGVSRKVSLAQIFAGLNAQQTIAATQISDSTTAGRALLTAADAAAQRTALSINNVDNTSDANKPVSTVQQTALNGKANTAHSHAIADVTGLQTALDAKAATSHTQAASTISDSTAAGRALLTAADAAAQRTALALGTADSPTFSNVSDSKGNLRDLPVTNRTAAYTAALSDTGGTIRISTGGVTVPSGVFSVGQAFSIVNNSASNQTITQGAGVTLRLAGTATTGNRTLAQYGQCTVYCVASNEFIISGPGLT
jgi:hypothetical protein